MHFAVSCRGLARRPGRRVVEHGCDFFSSLNTVPVADRQPQLGPAAFGQLVPLLLRQAHYPAHPGADGADAWLEEFVRWVGRGTGRDGRQSSGDWRLCVAGMLRLYVV